MHRAEMSRPSTPAPERFWRHVDKSGGCWVWRGGKDRRGYGLFRGHRSKMVRAHRFSWELHNQDVIPEGMLVCHHCDNPPCVRPDHLFVGTVQDNSDDMILKGRSSRCGNSGLQNGSYTRPDKRPRGERSGVHKVSNEQVRAIRTMWATSELSQTSIGALFGLTGSNVSCIVRRKTWRHIA